MKKRRLKQGAKADINKNKKIEPWEAARSRAIQRSMNKKKGKKRKSKNEQFYNYLNNTRLNNLNEVTRYRREDR